MSASVPLHAVLACELAPGASGDWLIARAEIEALAQAVSADLQALLPGIEQARLLLGGALLDAAELLRPGFPAHAALAEVGLRLPRGAGAVVGIGAHQGRMPAQALQPQAQFDAAPMRYLPLLIEADAAQAAALGTRLEQILAEAGEAGARTSDVLMRASGLRLQHARYLTLADLLALVCVQYEHAGFGAHWPLIEAALLTPARQETAQSPRGAQWVWTGTHIALETPRAFIARTQPAAQSRVQAYAAAVFELRQAAALFAAHALPLGVHADASGARMLDAGILEVMSVPPAQAASCTALRAPGLGIVALRQDDAAGVACMLATPLHARGLPALRAALGDCSTAEVEAALAAVDARGCPQAALTRH